MPNSDQIIIPKDFDNATVKLCFGGELLGGSSTRALIKDIQVKDGKVADESSLLALNGENKKSEIGQPEKVKESTHEMAKRLRATHGGTLNPAKLTSEEALAIDSVAGLLTDQERQEFENCHIKEMLTSKATGLKSDDHAVVVLGE